MTIYGPFETTTHYGNPRNYTSQVFRWRQAPIDHRKPLPFVRYVIKTTGGMVHASLSYDYHAGAEQASYDRAFGRFRKDVYATSSAIGAALGERHQTVNTIVGRAQQLLKAVNYLKRGNVKGMLATLGVKKPKSVGNLSADLGGQWLEYSYGWKPLVQDIYDSVDVLQQPFPTHLAKGRATIRYKSAWGKTPTFYTQDARYKTLIQSEVEVTNWPVYKANQLGLINPLAVAWELVPFSFVVDWFVPVGTFLQSLTDFAGLSLQNTFFTRNQQVFLDYRHWDRPEFSGTHQWVRIQRIPGSLPLPSLKPRFSGFFSARGANAIALLTQGLRNLKA